MQLQANPCVHELIDCKYTHVLQAAYIVHTVCVTAVYVIDNLIYISTWLRMLLYLLYHRKPCDITRQHFQLKTMTFYVLEPHQNSWKGYDNATKQKQSPKLILLKTHTSKNADVNV